RTVGGGEVVFLDPHHRRSDPAVPALLAQLAGAEPGPRVTAAVEMGVTSAADLSGQLRLPEPAVRAELSRLEVAGFVVQTGDRVWSRQRWTSLASRGADTLSKYHREHPLRSGMPSEELRQRLRVRPQDWGDVLGVLERQGTIRRKGPVVALAAHESSLKSRAADVDRVMGVLAAEPTTPPSGRDLLSAAGVDENLLAALVQEGLVVRVSPGLYLRREVYDRLVNEAIAIIDTRGHVNVAEFRDAAGTSRKYALAFLEHLDAIRVTRRVGDERVRGTRAPTCA
ncbi:MAG TPA: SelB C-terminal domain-containing protein, partial [Chloroflexota bacterium]|nr:SelB C-terminal domain-containing protein [Chloroflexota bacterium]